MAIASAEPQLGILRIKWPLPAYSVAVIFGNVVRISCGWNYKSIPSCPRFCIIFSSFEVWYVCAFDIKLKNIECRVIDSKAKEVV